MALKATTIEDVVAALEMLSLLVNDIYAPLVAELVDAARRFARAAQTKTMCGPEAVVELVVWIDDCFELFRSCLARGNSEAAALVKSHFQFNHESYARVVQRVTTLKLEALKKPAGRKPVTRPKSEARRASGNSSGGRQAIPVHPAVIAALPIHRGKKLCMRYLSVDGCPGEGDTCVLDYREHFVPNRLPPIVKNFIAKSFGGLRVSEAADDEPKAPA